MHGLTGTAVATRQRPYARAQRKKQPVTLRRVNECVMMGHDEQQYTHCETNNTIVKKQC